MTNKDKFIEVFGFEPDTETMIPVCPPRGVECPFMDDGIYSECHCELWWGREYKALEQEQYYKDLAESYEKTINKLTKAIAEQEPILDKIRAEIEHVIDYTYDSTDYDKALYNRAYKDGLYEALDILDKHKAESEG